MNKKNNFEKKADMQPQAINVNPYNDEWELEEFIELFTAELDKVQDTISLKSHARGLTFGPNAITLEVFVFPRFDAKLKKTFYRTAMPGEVGATMLKIEVPSLLRDQIQANGIQFQDVPNTSPLNELPGITSLQIYSLNRLGVFKVSDLKSMVVTPEMRTLLSTKTGIPLEILSDWLYLPLVLSVKKDSKGQLRIAGKNFGSSEQKRKQVLIDTMSAEILKWKENMILVKVSEDIAFRLLVVVTDEGVSNRFKLN